MSISKSLKFSLTSTLTLALTFVLTLALALNWFLSLRSVRLKIGDYYFKRGNFDQYKA